MGIRSQNNPIAAYLDVFSRSGTDASTNPGAADGIQASGGVVSDYSEGNNVYRAHVFTATGEFDVTGFGNYGTDVEYLVVAGGGGGGGQHGGGGGAGGLRTNLTGHPLAGAAFPVSIQPYTVQVGGGGAKQIGGSYPYPKNSTSGGNSAFGPITSHGGGTGGNWYNINGFSDDRQKGSAGGSGGGSGSNEANTQAPEDYRGAGNTPTQSPSQGNPGGRGRYGGGGGGGAGAGASPNPPASPYGGGYGGDGGAGTQVAIAGPTATTFTGVGAKNPANNQYQYFAGGGGGGSYNTAPNPNYSPDNRPRGGVGGGGKGGFEPDGSAPDSNGEDAQASTGGGGGGGGMAARDGGAGGSGIVIVRYQISELTATQKATGGSISFYGGKTIHVFTSSGTFTNTTGSGLAVEYIAIAGGGSGGVHASGGGGAGGVISNIPGFMPNVLGAPNVSPGSPNALTVTIGAGAAAQNNPSPGTNGTAGTNTTITGAGPWNQTAYGGGYGGGINNNGSSGGSGGGGAHSGGTGGARNPNSAPTYQGNPGGDGNSSGNGAGGGGGGAGGPGVNSPGPVGGAGGLGIQFPTAFRDPKAVYGFPGASSGGFFFAGGGGAGGDANPAPEYARGGKGPTNGNSGDNHAGAGGGGAGNPGVAATSAEANSGSGGGGRGYAPYQPNTTSGAGGSGIVIIAYPS